MLPCSPSECKLFTLFKLPNFYFSGFIFFSSVYYIPQFLQVALGDTPVRAGIYLIPLLVGQMAASWIAVRHILPTLKCSHKCTYREWRLVQQEDTRWEFDINEQGHKSDKCH